MEKGVKLHPQVRTDLQSMPPPIEKDDISEPLGDTGGLRQ